jgi:hypothetical protein
MGEAKMKRRVLFVHGAGPGAHEADSKLAALLAAGLGAGWDVACPKSEAARDLRALV